MRTAKLKHRPSRKTVYLDVRWVGMTGIGTFCSALQHRLGLRPLEIGGRPSSPLDILLLMKGMARLPHDSIVFNPGYNAPLFMVRPYVFTMHDLSVIDEPSNSSVLKRLYYRLVLKRGCFAAKRVLTVSDFSRRRIIEWSGVRADKVINVGNGVDPAYRPDGFCFKIGYPYVLAVGNRKSHKNEARLIEAFSRAEISTSIRLLFTGKSTAELESIALRCGVAGRVHFLGYIKDEELPPLYRGALALLFPSLYEGFGLPIVESMACGTPVLTSSGTGTGEVGADAVLTVEPRSTAKIAEGIRTLVEDAGLRAELRSRGIERARQFNWDQVAARVRAVLEDVVDETASQSTAASF